MKPKSSESKEFILFMSIALLISLVFSFAFFGMAGARVVLGIIFVSLPFYLMLNNFELEESEKTIFSAMLGLTIFPSLAYLLGLMVSFRISIAVIFVSLVIIAFIMKRRNAKNNLFIP